LLKRTNYKSMTALNLKSVGVFICAVDVGLLYRPAVMLVDKIPQMAQLYEIKLLL